MRREEWEDKMRITTSSLVESMTENIRTNQRAYQDIQNRISAGGQLTRPSDDPLAYSYVNRLKDARNQIQQYGQASKRLENELSFYENVFDSATGLLKSVREIALRAANSTVDEVDRKNLAGEVNATLQQMVALANSNVQGKYMFGGSKNMSPPFVTRGDAQGITTVTYLGDTADFHREVGFNDTVKINYHGAEVFSNQAGSGLDIFAEIVSLRDAIASGQSDTITGHLNSVDGAINQILGFRATNGNLIRHLGNLEKTWSELDISYAKNMEETGTVDMASLISALNAQEVAYRSTLYIAGTMGRVSLLDYLQ
jgi:flagellar hook-associated protein 3 FlgL